MAQNPWDIRTDDSRSEDTVTTFIIFCEDENAEPIYFNSLAVDGKLRINIVPNQKQGKLNLYNTIRKCCSDGLMEVVNGRYKLKEGITENIWCVYDRDMEKPEVENVLPNDDMDFTTAIQAAIDSGLNVAWSNDVFEIWVLLHFESIEVGTRLHRNKIYERLTEIFKTLPDQSDDLRRITALDKFYYKWHLKTKKHFENHVLPMMTEKRAIALENAAKLEGVFPNNSAYHDRNPCTMVHHLVHDLLAAQ